MSSPGKYQTTNFIMRPVGRKFNVLRGVFDVAHGLIP